MCSRLRSTRPAWHLVVSTALTALAAQPAGAQWNVVSFDELSLRPAHGVSVEGVTFGYRVGGTPSTLALFGYGDGGLVGPPCAVYVCPPMLLAPTEGVLTLSFAPQPVSALAFGLARSSATSPVGATIRVWDFNSVDLGAFPVQFAPFATEAEFRFTAPGSQPIIGRVDVEFSGPGTSFGVDNLLFTSAVIPEPAGGALVAGGLGILWLAGRRRARQARQARQALTR